MSPVTLALTTPDHSPENTARRDGLVDSKFRSPGKEEESAWRTRRSGNEAQSMTNGVESLQSVPS